MGGRGREWPHTPRIIFFMYSSGTRGDLMEGAPPPMGGPKFLGSYRFQLDGKGRLSLPAAFRREAAETRFVLLQAYAPSLTLYPQAAWREVEERLSELVRRQPEARMYVLKVMADAIDATPDAQGRILIPSRLQEAAELDGEALLVGAIDRIEIWNPQRFEAATATGAAAFERFAPQIFR